MVGLFFFSLTVSSTILLIALDKWTFSVDSFSAWTCSFSRLNLCISIMILHFHLPDRPNLAELGWFACRWLLERIRFLQGGEAFPAHGAVGSTRPRVTGGQ